MKQIHLIATWAQLIFLVIATATASANDVPSYDIVYTPQRSAEQRTETLANINIITQQDIEEKQFQSLEQALNTLPGVHITSNGSKGSLSALFYRGTESDHSIVLVDGVRISSLSTGAPSLALIPISAIERIEAVSGPNSSIYGADAIGGVIQIFTKNGRAGKSSGSIQIGAGSNDTKNISTHLSTSSSNNKVWLAVNSNHEQSDGFNSCSGSSSAGCFVYEPDDDSFRNQAVSIDTGFKFWEDKAKFSINNLSSSNRIEFDGNSFSGNQARNHQQIFSTKLELDPNQKFNLAISHAISHDKNRNLYNDAFFSSYNSKRNSSSLIGTYKPNTASKLLIGADFIREEISSSTKYQENSRNSKGLFSLGSYQVGDTTFEGSYRVDHYEQLEKEEVGGIAISQNIQGIKATVSHKKAFHLPTFNDLYFPFSSNPNLKPETSHTNELSFKGSFKNFDNRISFYRTRIEDLIAFDASFNPQNIHRARIKGAELSSAATFGNSRITLAANGMSSKDKSTGQDLARRPSLTGSLGLTQKINELLLGAQINSQNHFYEPNQTRVSGFTTYDATAQYQLSPSIVVGLKGINLGDKQYETVDFFNQPGREYHAFIKVTAEREN